MDILIALIIIIVILFLFFYRKREVEEEKMMSSFDSQLPEDVLQDIVENNDVLEFDEHSPEPYKYSVENDYYTSVKETYTSDPTPLDEMNDISDATQNTADNKYLQFVRMRGDREKKAIDGYISKNADYYRHHFTNEMERNENRDWWDPLV